MEKYPPPAPGHKSPATWPALCSPERRGSRGATAGPLGSRLRDQGAPQPLPRARLHWSVALAQLCPPGRQRGARRCLVGWRAGPGCCGADFAAGSGGGRVREGGREGLDGGGVGARSVSLSSLADWGSPHAHQEPGLGRGGDLASDSILQESPAKAPSLRQRVPWVGTLCGGLRERELESPPPRHQRSLGCLPQKGDRPAHCTPFFAVTGLISAAPSARPGRRGCPLVARVADWVTGGEIGESEEPGFRAPGG